MERSGDGKETLEEIIQVNKEEEQIINMLEVKIQILQAEERHNKELYAEELSKYEKQIDMESEELEQLESLAVASTVKFTGKSLREQYDERLNAFSMPEELDHLAVQCSYLPNQAIIQKFVGCTPEELKEELSFAGLSEEIKLEVIRPFEHKNASMDELLFSVQFMRVFPEIIDLPACRHYSTFENCILSGDFVVGCADDERIIPIIEFTGRMLNERGKQCQPKNDGNFLYLLFYLYVEGEIPGGYTDLLLSLKNEKPFIIKAFIALFIDLKYSAYDVINALSDVLLLNDCNELLFEYLTLNEPNNRFLDLDEFFEHFFSMIQGKKEIIRILNVFESFYAPFEQNEEIVELVMQVIDSHDDYELVDELIGLSSKYELTHKSKSLLCLFIASQNKHKRDLSIVFPLLPIETNSGELRADEHTFPNICEEYTIKPIECSFSPMISRLNLQCELNYLLVENNFSRIECRYECDDLKYLQEVALLIKCEPYQEDYLEFATKAYSVLSSSNCYTQDCLHYILAYEHELTAEQLENLVLSTVMNEADAPKRESELTALLDIVTFKKVSSNVVTAVIQSKLVARKGCSKEVRKKIVHKLCHAE